VFCSATFFCLRETAYAVSFIANKKTSFSLGALYARNMRLTHKNMRETQLFFYLILHFFHF